MRKLFTTLLLLIFSLSTLSVYADTWDDFSDLDKAWDGQKTITDKEFEEAIDVIQNNGKKKEEKQRKKTIRKIIGGGNSLHTELNHEKNLKEIPDLKKNEEGLLVNIPVNIFVEGKFLEKGYYKLIAKKNEENKIEFNFYQSQFLMGKIIATETQDDFNEKEVDFAKLIPYNESFMKLIYGSIDYNAYAFIPYGE